MKFKPLVILAVIVLAIIGIVFLVIKFFLAPIDALLSRGIHAIQRTLYTGVRTVENTTHFQFCPSEEYTKALEARITQLTIKNASLSISQQENQELRNQLHFSQATQRTLLEAHIIGSTNELGISSLLIDKGEAEGAKPDLAVLVEGGIIIGKIHTVSPHSAEVILLNDRRSKLVVSILENKKATGVAEGQFGLGVTMTQIPVTETIKTQDIVATAGIEASIPQGLVVGTILETHAKDKDLFQEATIKPAINYKSLSTVGILLAP